MLEECAKAGPTDAGNYKHPTYPGCLKWVVQSWEKLDTAGVQKAAKRLGMSADSGPEVAGYVNEHFQDVEHSGAEIEASAPGSVENDLPNEDQLRESSSIINRCSVNTTNTFQQSFDSKVIFDRGYPIKNDGK